MGLWWRSIMWRVSSINPGCIAAITRGLAWPDTGLGWPSVSALADGCCCTDDCTRGLACSWFGSGYSSVRVRVRVRVGG